MGKRKDQQKLETVHIGLFDRIKLGIDLRTPLSLEEIYQRGKRVGGTLSGSPSKVPLVF